LGAREIGDARRAEADDENGADIDRQKVTLYLGNRAARADNAQAAKSRPGVTLINDDALRGFSPRERVDVGRGERISSDPPVSALDFFDHAPSDLTHVFALDRDHGVGQLRDDLLLLFLGENVFDDSDLNERH
jgi:hypothetical protein